MTTTPNRRVVIICGGPSVEASVSRLSAGRVLAALKQHYSDLHVLELGPEMTSELIRLNPDVVFPILHGPPGEDGTIQGLLDVLGLPYVGSGVTASAIAMDKLYTKRVLAHHNIPMAEDLILHKNDGIDYAVSQINQKFGTTVVVKPRSLGSTIAIKAVSDTPSLEQALRDAFAVEDDVLAEEFIIGREVTVGVLDRPTPEALPVLEIRTNSGAWFDYDHKYTPGLSQHLLPAPISDESYRYCQETSLLVHRLLGLRDYSRTDFMIPESGSPIFLETNTIPGMTPTSMLPDAVEHTGMSFSELTAFLVEQACQRGPRLYRKE